MSKQTSRSKAGKPSRQAPFSAPLMAPVATARQFANRKPSLRYEGGKCIVAHCERAAALLSTSEFLVVEFPLNPGIFTTFPWLASVAQRFEKYRFRKLAVYYRPKTATTTTGDVAIAIDYDAGDDVPMSTVQMENYADAVSGPPWAELVMRASKMNLSAELAYYVRTGAALEPGMDVKTYDVGNLLLACEGSNLDSVAIGNIFIDYEVELMTEQLNSGAGQQAGGSFFLGGTPTVTAPFGDEPVSAVLNEGFQLLFNEDDSNNYLTLGVIGDFLLTFWTGGVSASNPQIVIGATQGLTIIDGREALLAPGGGDPSTATRTVILRVTDTSATMQINSTNDTNAATLWIAKAPDQSLQPDSATTEVVSRAGFSLIGKGARQRWVPCRRRLRPLPTPAVVKQAPVLAVKPIPVSTRR